MSRWTQEGVRVLSLARAAAERMGWAVADRFFAVERPPTPGGDRADDLRARPTPFTADDNRRLREAGSGTRVPHRRRASLDGHLPIGDRLHMALATTDDPESGYPPPHADISPVVDDRPFFFQGYSPRPCRERSATRR